MSQFAAPTLAVGQPMSVMSKPLGLPPSASSFTPLRKSVCLLVGSMGSGKSFLAEDIPNSVRINSDLRASKHNARCFDYPRMIGGKPYGSEGKPIVLNWPAIVSATQTLVRDAQSSNPGFETVIFDTVDTIVGLLKPWCAKEIFGSEAYSNLDARKFYPRMAEELIEKVLNPLRQAGYGILFTCHVISNEVFVDEKLQDKQKEDLRISGTFRAAIEPCCDMIGRMVASKAVELVTEDQEIKLPDGSSVMRKVNSTKEVHKVEIKFHDPSIPNLLKVNYAAHMPKSLVIPQESPWDFLESQYKEAAKKAGVQFPST